MPLEPIDVDKTLLFQLCKFLSKKAWERKGMRRPVSIPLGDFAVLFNYSRKKTLDESWIELREEIVGLAEDKEPDNRQQPLLCLDSATETLLEKFPLVDPTKRLILKYDREQIDRYADILQKRDLNRAGEYAAEGLNHVIKNDSLVVRLADKSMSIRGASTTNAGCFLLLTGEEATNDNMQKISIRGYAIKSAESDMEPPHDYTPGVKVSTRLLAKILFENAWEEQGATGRSALIRKIRDALKSLDRRAERLLGMKLFDITEGKDVSLKT